MPTDDTILHLLEELLEHLPRGAGMPSRGGRDRHAAQEPVHLLVFVLTGGPRRGGLRAPVMPAPHAEPHEEEDEGEDTEGTE